MKQVIRVVATPGIRRSGARQAALAFLFGAMAATPCAAQSVGIEVRAGVVVSSALAEDVVANPRLVQRLGGAYDGPVRAEPAPGPMLLAAAVFPLRSRTSLELAIGWTAARLNAVDAGGTRKLQDMGAGQATIAVRYEISRRLDAGCGFGALRYFADGGLFENGSDIAPLLECGTGFDVTTSGIVVRASGQAHRFRTPVLRDAGAQSGTVFRLSVQAGYAFGWRH